MRMAGNSEKQIFEMKFLYLVFARNIKLLK